MKKKLSLQVQKLSPTSFQSHCHSAVGIILRKSYRGRYIRYPLACLLPSLFVPRAYKHTYTHKRAQTSYFCLQKFNQILVTSTTAKKVKIIYICFPVINIIIIVVVDPQPELSLHTDNLIYYSLFRQLIIDFHRWWFNSKPFAYK